jgi:hypothetical protein
MALRAVLYGLVSVATLAAVIIPIPPVWSQGLLIEKPEIYRSFRSAPKYRSFLPPSVDLSPHFPEPGNQGTQGSCTAWAVGYGVRSYYEYRDLPVNRVPRTLGFSPAYLYNQIKIKRGDCDSGAFISHALRFLQAEGIAPLPDFPYTPANCSALPLPELKMRAANFVIDDWYRISIRNLDDIKGTLAQGDPVIIGMMLSESFENLEKDTIYEGRNDGGQEYAHAMVVVGYDDKNRAFKLFNSWGKNWGDGGFGRVSYKAFADKAVAAYAMKVSKRGTLAQLYSTPRIKPVGTIIPEPPGDAPTLEDIISSAGGDTECAKLTLDRTGGTPRISGYMGSQKTLKALRARIAKEVGGVAIDYDVALRPWPQCETLQTFGDAIGAPQGLTIDIGGKPGTPVLKEGDFLSVHVRAPAFPSYIYVTYLQSGGDAVHLIQPGPDDAPVAPGRELVFGRDPLKNRFRISPPFGGEMIVAIASARRLFEAAAPTVQIEREFLSTFRQVFFRQFQGKTKSKFAAAVAYLTTSKQTTAQPKEKSR